MHTYYAKKAPKLKKAMNALLKPISAELEERCGKPYPAVFAQIWTHYEKKYAGALPL